MRFTELHYQDPRTKTYLGSPALVRLPDGALLASHDFFGPGCPRNAEGEEHLTAVYRSEDDGVNWKRLTLVANAYWSSLFMHRGAVYLFGTTQQYGSIVIRRSDDGGFTWTHPRDGKSGLLFRGGYFHDAPNYHCAPMPITYANGRIYRSFEDNSTDRWGPGFLALVVSAPEDADLLDAGSWTMSNKLAFDPAWLPAEWPAIDNPGWLEGNAVAAPDGQMLNILRFNSPPVPNRAIITKLSADGKKLSYDPADGLIVLPGGMHKFTIRFDPVSRRYLTLANPTTGQEPQAPTWQRNILSLLSSANLRDWTLHSHLIQDDLGLAWKDSIQATGFQYVDWFIEGEEILYLVRTAYDGAHNFHDSNRITFHRCPRFRELLGRTLWERGTWRT